MTDNHVCLEVHVRTDLKIGYCISGGGGGGGGANGEKWRIMAKNGE